MRKVNLYMDEKNKYKNNENILIANCNNNMNGFMKKALREKLFVF